MSQTAAVGQNGQNKEDLLKHFEGLLACIQETGDSQQRRKAEESLSQACSDNALLYLECLLQCLIRSSKEEVRHLATILFRQHMEPNVDTLNKISPQTWSTFETALMTALNQEQSKLVYFSVCDCIGTFGSRILPEGGWNSLLPDLLKMTQLQAQPNKAFYHKQGFLRVLRGLGEYAIGYLKQHLSTIHDLLNDALKDENVEVRLEAFKALTSVTVSLKDENLVKNFSDTVKIALELLKIDNDDTIQTLLTELIALSQHRSVLVEPYLQDIVTRCVSVINNGAAEFKTRQMCLEELIVLCDSLGHTVRQNKEFCQTLLKLLLLFCAEYDESLNFSDPSDDDEQQFVCAGQDGMGTVSDTLGAKIYFEASRPLVLEWLQSTQWKQVFAACWCLVKGVANMRDLPEFSIKNYKKPIPFNGGDFSALLAQADAEAKNGAKPTLRFVDQVVLKLCSLVVSHDRNEVKLAALIALNVIAENIDDEFHRKYYDVIFSIVKGVLQGWDKFHERVVLNTIRLLAQFATDCPPEAFETYANDILQCLSVIVTQDPKEKNNYQLHEEACIAIGTCAKLLGNNFMRYYESFFGIMVKLLENCKDPQNQSLRGKAMECIGLMGEAVGNVRFSQDAHKLMNVLIPLRNELLRDTDSSAYTHLNHLFARIGRIIGDDFVQYFDSVIPHIMQSARIEAVRIAPASDPDPEDPNLQVIKFHVRGHGDTKLIMNATNLDEKSTACHMLYQFCKDHPVGYFPYLLETAEILMPLMRYPYNSRVRVASNAIAPLILKSVVRVLSLPDAADGANQGGQNYKRALAQNDKNVRNGLQEVFDKLLGGLLQALTLERDVCDQVALLTVLTKFVSAAGQSRGFWVLTDAQMNEIAEDLDILFTESFARRQDIAEKYGNSSGAFGSAATRVDDKIESEISLLSEIEENLMSGCVDVVEWCFRSRKEAFMPAFDKFVAKHAMAMLEGKFSWQTQQFNEFSFDATQMKIQGLCLMIDAVELGGEEAAKKYLQWLYGQVEPLCNSEDYETKQTAIFAIGMIAQVGSLPNALNIWLKQFGVFCNEFRQRMKGRETERRNEEEKNGANGADEESDDEDGELRDMEMIYDNCCSAVGKILRHMPGDNGDEQLKAVMNWIRLLPVQYDEAEVGPSFDNLVAFMEKYGGELVKNSEMVERIIYSTLFWLSRYQENPSEFEHLIDYDFDDDIKKPSIKVPMLDRERASKACGLLNQLKQSVGQSVFENVDAKFSAQEKFDRDTICKMYQL